MKRAAIDPAASCFPGFAGIAKLASVVAVAFALAGLLAPNPASAQILKRGVQGGVAGAVIGGIAGGSDGIGKGAAIGAGAGLAVGALERESNRRRAYAAPPPPPPAYGGQLVADTQAALTRLGYRPGPIDGVMGPGTSSAIRNYQYAYGLPVTGRPSPSLLDHMYSRGG
ncbi:peptidoglycan-binding domain-containing protein [Methyloligella solikamskensis]|uniref:Peptidoglycan-binding domain-containing protein n=1 Tax=Methyloligella solikamskensis TaxID=1177756 RepID=A0ABW3JAP1_9HYPH